MRKDLNMKENNLNITTKYLIRTEEELDIMRKDLNITRKMIS